MHTSALNDAARSLFEDAICQYGGNGLQAGTEEQRRKSSGTARPKANQMRPKRLGPSYDDQAPAGVMPKRRRKVR